MKNLDKSNCRPNKLWINKDNKGYNRSMKSWLEKYNIQEKLKEDLLLLKKESFTSNSTIRIKKKTINKNP